MDAERHGWRASYQGFKSTRYEPIRRYRKSSILDDIMDFLGDTDFDEEDEE